MSVESRNRLVLGMASPLVLVGALVAVQLLPGPRPCPSFDCGNFNSGAVNVFGSDNLTVPQTLALGIGIWAAAWLLARSVFPVRVLTSAGIATAVLALALAWLLPERVIGPAPSVVCSTPDSRGHPVYGRCDTGPAPVDNRAGDRALVLTAGLAVLGVAVMGDRTRMRAVRPSLSS